MNFGMSLLFLMTLISVFFAWKDCRKKVKKAEGEEEIRNVFVPFLLTIFLFILAIVVFIF
ncbi:hypothetical protein [Oceanobacillus saliphilus]|uniref:hypothetical protein n=1 Tax=Oceanobacillus saliphilus TaxID=2925834 RepID=UPI00201D77E2|nr:hypothetical protein [Oceanobacillus saliphilus]